MRLIIATAIAVIVSPALAQIYNHSGSSVEYPGGGGSFGQFQDRDGSTTIYNDVEAPGGGASFYNDSHGRVCGTTDMDGFAITNCN